MVPSKKQGQIQDCFSPGGAVKAVTKTINIEYDKSLDRRRLCLEDELNGESNNIVQSNKSV